MAAPSSTSPLVQVNVGNVKHKPKVVALYERLLTEDSQQPGYWVEFFLLPVARNELLAKLRELSNEELISKAPTLQTLMAAAVTNLQSDDVFLQSNTLEIMQVVFRVLLFDKKLSSRDVITALAGLDRIDHMMDQLTDSLLMLLSGQLSHKTVLFLSIVAAGSTGTSLASYFGYKNFFTPLIMFIDARPTGSPEQVDAFLAIGILANLNKFNDSVDVYLQRINDFVDQDIMSKLITATKGPLDNCRYDYVYSLTAKPSWLGWFGQPAAPAKPLADLPQSPEIAILMPLYEFAVHNDVFAVKLVTMTSEFRVLIELSSHLVQNQTNVRTPIYARLVLLMFRKFVESPTVFAQLVNPENKAEYEISQQRAPPLERDATPRLPLAGILDIIQCSLRFNVRKTMDNNLYTLIFYVLLQAFAALRQASLVLPYNWPQLWQTLLLLLKHLNKSESAVGIEVASMASLAVAHCLIERDLFPAEQYADLFYNVVNHAEIFQTLASKYALAKTASLAAIHAMVAHYELLSQQNPDLTEQNISDVVKQGQHAAAMYDKQRPKSLLTRENLPRFSEVNEQRFLKRVTRVAFVDAISFT